MNPRRLLLSMPPHAMLVILMALASLLPSLAYAARPGATHAARPASFTTAPVSTVLWNFTTVNPLTHWRFNGQWTTRAVTSGAISVTALEMVSASTVGEANFAATPGVYLLAGSTYTLSYRRDAIGSNAPFTIGYSSKQDGTGITNITSFTIAPADEYATVYNQTFTVPATGAYHFIIKQSPFRVAPQPRDRLANISITGPGAVAAPVALVNTGPDRQRSNPIPRVRAPERANMGLQILTLVDSQTALSKVEYWAENMATGNSVKVGESTSPTNYSAAWNNLPLGVYDIRAKLLDNRGLGAFSATPLSVTVVPNELSVSTFLGGSGTDDVRAMVYQPDGTLVMAVNSSVNPPGVTPTYLNGATAASAGAIIRFSSNGRQVLNMVRLATQVADMATDAQGRLYVAAGLNGSMRIKADLSAIEWQKTYPGQYAHRIDAGTQGSAVVMIANETDPNDGSIGGNVRLMVYSATGSDLFSTGAVSQYTTDVAIDDASQTMIGTGHKVFNTTDPDGTGQSLPVFVPVVKGWAYDGTRKYTAYDWSSDITSPRHINRPESNMADTRASRATIGKDGKLYVVFECDGGNHPLRYDPFDIMLPVSIVGGDEYFTFSNTRSESKTFIGRYDPGTGAYLRGQQLTGRISNGGNENDRIGNTITMQSGNVTADADGRVYMAGDAASGPPLTIDHLPGQYTGGAYVIVLSPDMARREAAFRVTRNKGRAVAAINLSTWAYGGSADRNLLYPTNAPQPVYGGGQEGFYVVTGGSNVTVAAPTIAVTTPVNITTTATPIISGTATPNALVTVRGPVSVTGGVASLTASPTGAWSTSALTFVGGPNAITATASNVGGTSTPAVASFTVNAPVPLPVVDIRSPVNQTGVVANVSIRGTATPNAVVVLTFPASATGGPISLTASSTGQWVTSQSVYRFPTGPNTITAVATNANGTSTPDLASFTVTAPQPVPAVRISGPTNTTTAARPTITGTATAFAVVTLTGGSGTTGGPVTVTANGSGAWSTSAITFPVGVNSVTARSSNAGGISTPALSTFTVTTSATLAPPAVVISTPRNQTTLSVPTINGNVTSNASVTVSGTGATNSPVVITATSNGAWTVSNMQFPLGENTITAIAQNAGGTTSPVTSVFTVVAGQVTPPPPPPPVLPTVTITSPRNVTTLASPVISGTATANSSVTVSGPVSSTGGPVVLAVGSAGTWSTTGIRFAVGVNTITAISSTTGGTSSAVTSSFTVTAAPVSGSAVSLGVRVLLQGAIVSATAVAPMRDDLRTLNQIPLVQPYAGLGFVQAGGGGNESITNAVLGISGNNAPVDWVLVELRDPTDPRQIVATRAGLVQRDGDVVDVDGVSSLSFNSAVLTGNRFHVAIRHRNHLAAMSANPVALTGTTPAIDFTSTATPIYQLTLTNGQVLRGPMVQVGTRMALWSGDLNGDGRIICQGPNNEIPPVFDAVFSAPNNAVLQLANFVHTPVYLTADANLDGQVIYQGGDNEINYTFFNVLDHPENAQRQSIQYVIVQHLPTGTAARTSLRQRFPTGIPALNKGVNLSSWFGSSVPVGNFTNRFGPTQFAHIKNMGFQHVRVPIGPNQLFQESTPGVLNPVCLSALTAGVDGLIAAGLAVIIDPIHPNGDNDFEQKLANDPAFLPKAQAYWRAIATHFASRPTDKVFFEIMNEPHMTGPAGWYNTAQTALIAAVRAVAPQHIIIATAADWGSMEALLNQTSPDKNVVWNFHYYSAMVFTHQAATWVTPEFSIMANVPYPSTPQNVSAAVAYIAGQTAASATTRQTATNWVNFYGSERWDAAKLATDLGQIVTWANQHGVLVTCNEFGVFSFRSPADSRQRWINDTRTVLDQNNIGWSLWEYDEGFGLVSYSDPINRVGPIIDNAIKTALGL